LAFLSAFGRYLPSRVVPSAEIGARVGSDAEWIFNVSGIEERRFANGETVAEMAAKAGADCLERAGLKPADLGMIIVGSGSAERRFPGPAASVAQLMGATQAVGLDLPLASAASLFGLSLASRLIDWYDNILVIGSEKMSSVVLKEPMERGVAILFGDGAGACLLRKSEGFARVVDSEIRTDGAYSEDLRLEFDQPLAMNGRSVIMQASRKIPNVISSLLERNERQPGEVPVFMMHQANQNLIDRVAAALGVENSKFFSNIRSYGNTSSASMLIAASEWFEKNELAAGDPVVFAAFGAGFHWGALLAEAT